MKKLMLSLALLSCMSVCAASDNNRKGFSACALVGACVVTYPILLIALNHKKPFLVPIAVIGGHLGYRLGYDIGSVIEQARKNK